MLADYCWIIARDDPYAIYKRQTKKRRVACWITLHLYTSEENFPVLFNKHIYYHLDTFKDISKYLPIDSIKGFC